MLKDQDGKTCNAKIIYNISTMASILTACLVILKTTGPVDYVALGMFVGACSTATGAVYWGRNKTKSDKVST